MALSTVQRGVAEHERAADGAVAAAQTVVADDPVEVPERPADIDAEGLYMQVIAAHVRAVEDLGALAATADHAGAKVGAAKAHAQTARSLAEMLALVGLLPDPARVLLMRAEREQARRVAKQRGEALLVGGAR